MRGKSPEGVQDEISEIQASVEESKRNKASALDLFKSKGNVKALIISSGLVSFQQLSGINVILFYSTSIFQKTGSDLEPAVASILVGKFKICFLRKIKAESYICSFQVLYKYWLVDSLH